MSVSELNHFMTYVIEGWMLFSAGFIATTFVSFVSRRIQEDMEAAALTAAITEDVTEDVTEVITEEAITEEAKEAARLEEVAAVSEQLAKNRDKQTGSSSVSVST